MQNPSLKRFAAGDLENELKLTRRLLERVPDEHLGWRPHEKSWTLGQLATHLSNLPTWHTAVLRDDGLDLATLPPNKTALPSRDAILRTFDENVQEARETFAQVDDDTLIREWTLRHGDRVMLVQPKAAVLRMFGISHMIHHRGQMTVYLRLLGVPLPPIYGPTADEQLAALG